MPPSDGVNEDRLELEFFPVLKRSMQEHFGAERVEIFKPTRGQEALVAFDQGFSISGGAPVLTHDAFLRELGKEIRQSLNQSRLFYLGYFLQFKVVEPMTYKVAPVPASFSSPYLRVTLDLEPNRTTNLSQHTTLRRLAAMAGADVYYACPMVFDVNTLKREASLDTLALARVADAPATWRDGEKHFLMFQAPDGDPWWCSDPIRGRRVPFHSWMERTERRDPRSTTRWLESARIEHRMSLPVEARFRGGYPESMRLARVSMDRDILPLLPLERG